VDLNHRPLGYEPNELPDCSTPHLYVTHAVTDSQGHPRRDVPCGRDFAFASNADLAVTPRCSDLV
jgi:hypothetical protein